MTLNLLSTNNISFSKQLEWNLLCEQLASFSKLSENKNKLSNPLYFENNISEETFQTLSLYVDYIQNESDYSDWPLSDSLEFNTLLNRALKGSYLDLQEINFFATCVEYLPHLPENLLNRSPIFFSKQKHKDEITLLIRQLVKPIRSFVSIEGEVDYSRHPLLYPFYKQLDELESVIRSEIKKIQQSDEYCNDLQIETFDFFDDRYVLLIRSDRYRYQHGKIVRKSETGHTFYVEPSAIKDLSNKRVVIQSQIDEIIFKIIKTFNLCIVENSPFLQNVANAYLFFDDYLSKAKFSDSLKLSPPVLTSSINIKFKNLFHPLINNPVKNDVFIDSQSKGLIISGPNTGGKTALLKSITLSILLARKGLFVPAEEAEFNLYTSIFYIGNDQQNLTEGLSSFSSEVKNYLQLINELTDKNLIIIDEVFNSTSSEEASALALSTFDFISSISFSHFIVSTHHQMLKSLIFQRNDFISGHMGFDLENQKPTFKLSTSGPGSSMALAIFKNLSLTYSHGSQIVLKAQEYLDKKQVSYESLLAELSHKEVVLDKKITEAETIRSEILNQKKSNESLLKIQFNEELKRKKGELNKILDEARDWVSLLPKVSSFDLPSKNKINNTISSYERKISNELSTEDENTNTLLGQKPTEEYQLQKNYYCSLVKKDVTLIELIDKKNMGRIRHGQMTLLVPLSTLYKSNNNKSNSKQDFVFNYDRQDSSFTLDCRGMRLDSLKNEIDIYLSRLISGDIPYLSVIHGHGDGVLKGYIRQYLTQRKEFRWEQGDNGNDGETKIYLN